MSRNYRLVIYVLLFSLVRAEDKEPFTSAVLNPEKTQDNTFEFAGKKYYFGVSVKANFFQAFRLCKEMDMDLVSIESHVENHRLAKFTTEIGVSYNHFWTSGTNLHDRDQWMWLSTGKTFFYTNWYPTEPNFGASGSDYTENCVEIRTVDRLGFTWNNVPCQRMINFICEAPSKYVTGCK